VTHRGNLRNVLLKGTPVNCRHRFASSIALLFIFAQAGLAQPASSGRQLYELRTYHFASADKQTAFADFLEKTAIPAFNRAGVQTVGVWKMLAKDNAKLNLKEDSTDLYVLLPHNSFEELTKFESKLAADEVYQKEGAAILNARGRDVAYTRYDSMLLLAMEGAPHIAVPSKSPTRVMELRTYLSPNAERAKNKLDMFNKGEFQIFNKVGMPGIFYGSAVVGPDQPQLTYMIVHESFEANTKNWAAFFAHPDWKALNQDRSYAGNVSKALNYFLRPTGGSQI
jgi:hypothetical protein